ncbi:MAG: L-ribulose-5-phosphate 4-epimerase [Spirochaetes bacterium RBG_13_68_11]|nr:MAG: L-ribulose-5-phosphate 4-epimerase [Spirochaetes bacterium RBG_13_68_11]
MNLDAKRTQRLREQVCQANLDLVARGLVIETFGNVSGVDRELGIVAIKPSGVSYDELEPSSIALVDLEGRRVAGGLNPSSDTPTHVRLYREFPHIGGVVHTHSRYATAWAQARRPLPCLGTTHADYFRGTVPCTALISDAQIAGEYEEETAVQIVEAFRKLDYREVPAVLVASHGPFTWGKDAAEAVYHAAMLEYAAECAAIALGINARIVPAKRTLVDKHFLRKHGARAYYGQGEHPTK